MRGHRKLVEARNEAPARSDEEPVTATPRCPPIQRLCSIPRRQRPLGVTALEDKIAQRATVEVLNAIYETDFLDFSYGFRPGRSPHHALDALYTGLLTKKVNWVLDLDIKGFLDPLSQCSYGY
jgi:retron-type reverse transcriptase